ncbi:MAG: transposase [Pikeienuella sp.]
MDRDLIDATARGLIAPFLPPESGRRGRPLMDNRRVLQGIFRIARAGAPWRDLLDRFG